jgi:hypothetical protein
VIDNGIDWRLRSAGAVLDVDLETGVPLTRFLRLSPENEIELAADEIPKDDSGHRPLMEFSL